MGEYNDDLYDDRERHAFIDGGVKRTASPDRAGLLREVGEALEEWKRPILGTTSLNGNLRAQEAQSTEALVRINAAYQRALAATGDPGGPLDVERLARCICASRPPEEPADLADDLFVDDECRGIARRAAAMYAAGLREDAG